MRIVILVLVILLISVAEGKSCEPITVPMCKDIGYTMTQFPNSLGHASQAEAGLEAHQFYPFVEAACDKHFKEFICALYVPKCDPTEVGTDLVLPKRKLCQDARDECESLLNKYGFYWGGSMECKNFPAEGKSCEPITVPMCKDIGYAMTHFPNSLGHTRQEEAGLEAHQFYPLVKINCSEHLKEFICALYFPKCDPNEASTDLVLPKQQLCQKSRDGCEPLMNKFGFEWPERMKCENFPAEGKSCEPITVPMCKDIGYTMTQFPNSLGHTSQEEAGIDVYHLDPFVEVNCSEYLKEFICALYVPKCDPNEVGTDLVLPSQELCQKARDGCEQLMNWYGFYWPDKMKCENIHAEGKSCEPITVPMCKDIGYTMTQFPNSLGHASQAEAGMEAHQFYPLVEINCSEHLKEFICALYVPKCDPNEVGIELVLPTRQLCQKARDGCQPLMNMYGFYWPDKMACENFRDSEEIAA